MNCANCKHKGAVVPGSSHHISCTLVGDITAQLEIALLRLRGRELVFKDKTTGKQTPLVVLDQHGVRNGWCDWPIQFDPIWVKECAGYTELKNLG